MGELGKMNPNKLLVSEVFYSLQGEGSTMGIPAIFLRLSGCNLLCDGAWRCDTIEVWQKGNTFEFKDVLSSAIIQKLRRGAHLVITGGEPLLQQERILSYIKWFEDVHGFFPFLEIETNGTILPSEILAPFVDQWNVSPKLASSGVRESQRLNLPILSHFNRRRSIFKFVISSEDDWKEINDLFLMAFVINPEKVWLMPAASNIDELLDKNQLVSRIALEKQVNFCTRLQVEIWNKTTGV